MATSALMPTTMPSIARLARSLLASKALTAFAKISLRSMTLFGFPPVISKTARRLRSIIRLLIEIYDQAVWRVRHYSVDADREHPRELFLRVSRPYVELFAVRPGARGQISVTKLDPHAQDLVVDAPERDPRKGLAPPDHRMERGVAQYQTEFRVANFLAEPPHQFDVERGQHDLRLASPLPDYPQRRHCGARVFDLQVEPDLAQRQVERLVERGHALALAGVGAPDFGQRQSVDAPRQVRRVIERRVVNDHDVIVAGDVQVEFDHLRALPDGEIKGAQRVLGFVGRCAAMGDDEWGHKVSNFELIIVRINGRLTGVIRPRRIVRSKVSVIQRKILSPFAHNQVFSGLVFEPDSPQITDYLVPNVRAIRKFQIVRI